MTRIDKSKFDEVISKAWWSKNDTILDGVFREVYGGLGTKYLTNFDKLCDAYRAVARHEEVKKRGITVEEVIIWETAKRVYANTRIRITT
jgi:hypothetical protein